VRPCDDYGILTVNCFVLKVVLFGLREGNINVMATAEQVKTLIRSHFSGLKEQFSTIALQVAAHEAMQGHQELAFEIREIVDRSQGQVKAAKVFPYTPELEHLVSVQEPKNSLSELVLAADVHERLQRVIFEYQQRDKLQCHGMAYRRKILLVGPPGTGKTMSASVLAFELGLPLCRVMIDRLVTKFMGETSAKLRLVFDGMSSAKGVYLFDEFDAIGGDRGKENDVGEMRRVMSSFLQFIEQDPSDSIIVAATNNPGLLDQALFRRFDDVLFYSLPKKHEIEELISNRLANYVSKTLKVDAKVIAAAGSLSHADIVRACDDAVKEMILRDSGTMSVSTLCQYLRDRQKRMHRDVKMGMR